MRNIIPVCRFSTRLSILATAQTVLLQVPMQTNRSNPESRSAASVPSTPNGLQRGEYAPAKPTDLRSPCPMLNCLANHGYLPRDGRRVRAKDFTQAMSEVGVSTTLAAAFTHPLYLERATERSSSDQQQPSLDQKLLQLIRNSWKIFSGLGMWKAGQCDANGEKYLNLDQLAEPGIMEHDISLTRLDHAQGDNTTVQPPLVKALLASSSDGGHTLTAENLAAVRLQRIQAQKAENPAVQYGSREHDIACLSISTFLQLLGDGKSVPCEYARVLFLEERLPTAEGWRRRGWWTLGLLELGWGIHKIKSLIGLRFS
ncbi:hypothetical protein PWT90_08775 [Aphanocladium album]|nr:hypothetical protein PWT90_08775 [Aphanocladium album]